MFNVARKFDDQMRQGFTQNRVEFIFHELEIMK